MDHWLLFLALWIGSQTLQVIGAVRALREKSMTRGPLDSLVISVMASLLPAVTLILFLMVFVIGGSSNVAQLAGPPGHRLWALWADAWPLLFIGNPVSFIILLIAVALPPYPPRSWPSFGSRVGALLAAGFAWCAVVTFFPDA